MPIPNNISRDHILKAIRRIDKEGIPPRRNARSWAVSYKEGIYPCKLLFSWANIYANAEELDSSPNNFQTNMAKNYLTSLGFSIVAVRQ